MTRIVRGGQAGLMKYQPEAFGSGRQTMRARPGGAGPARLPCHAWHRELRGKLTLARSDSDSAPGRPGHAEQPAVTPISVFCRGRRRAQGLMIRGQRPTQTVTKLEGPMPGCVGMAGRLP
jgi:hypothetical protein